MDVAIVGGGISGLLTAHFLKSRGLRPHVFEASPRVGGWIRSESRLGSTMEWGPNTLMANRDWFDVFNSLGLSPLLAKPASRRRFIVVEGKKRALPMNPFKLLGTSLISGAAKWALVRDLMGQSRFPESDLTIADFFKRALHEDILKRFVDPFVSGIYAGDVEKLSAAACFPKVWDAKQGKGSIIRGLLSGKREKLSMVSFATGMEELVGGLSHQLGSLVHLNTKVSRIEKANDGGFRLETLWGSYSCSKVVIATPSAGAARILEGHLPSSSLQMLQDIRYQDVMVWNCLFTRPKNFSSGFGCLIPRSEGQPLLGSLWSSEIFPDRGRPDILVASQFFSGTGIPDKADIHLKYLCHLLGTREEDLLWQDSKTFVGAIPQFSLGHRDRIQKLRDELPSGIFLAGNYLDGVGLSHALQTAKAVAQQIMPTS